MRFSTCAPPGTPRSRVAGPRGHQPAAKPLWSAVACYRFVQASLLAVLGRKAPEYCVGVGRGTHQTHRHERIPSSHFVKPAASRLRESGSKLRALQSALRAQRIRSDYTCFGCGNAAKGYPVVLG